MSDNPAKLRPAEKPDSQGLVFGRHMGAAGEVTLLAAMPAALPRDGDGWLWAHLDLVDRRSFRWLASLGLPLAALSAFSSEDTRPHVEAAGGVVSGALMEMHTEPSVQIGRRRLLRFAAGESWLITARHHPLEDIDALRGRLDSGLQLAHPAAVLARFVESSVDRYQHEIDAMLASLNWIEDVVIERGGSDASARVSEIRRKAVTMHREMSLNKAVIGRLSELVLLTAPPAATQQALAADYQKAETLHGELHTIGDRARLLKDEIASNISADMNHSLYVISMVSALLLPPSLIFGLFGTNVGGLPFLNHEYGFWAVTALGLVSSAAVFMMLRRRW
ncbi:MAG: hypothetical protein KGO53_04420 [Alphaproteobacteria bacterium]|nr:hypothetical protein [Alphaproteobacteria bacterium]